MSVPRKITDRERWRDHIDIGRCLALIETVEGELTTPEEISANRTAQLRLLSDIQFKKLAKLLPDLKSVEVSGGSEPVVLKWQS